MDSIISEIGLRKNYLDDDLVQTIYFGGGTPSLLEKNHIDKILEKIYSSFTVDADAEITLEANPDDLTSEKLSELKFTSINRLSIGVQSFLEKDLIWMNRLHSAEQAIFSITEAQKQGFENISIDLIYGLPDLTKEEWNNNLTTAFNLSIQHLSCYCLTIEPKTPLAAFIKSGKRKNINEELGAMQFETLMAKAHQDGWAHYEISNFCKDGFHSRHNSSYWSGVKYLGLGPSAHSYDGKSRQWNVSNNHQYIQAMEEGIPSFGMENLSPVQQLNEYIMTSLRTMWGIDLKNIQTRFGENYAFTLNSATRKFQENGWLYEEDDKVILTDSGKLIADRIILDLSFD